MADRGPGARRRRAGTAASKEAHLKTPDTIRRKIHRLVSEHLEATRVRPEPALPAAHRRGVRRRRGERGDRFAARPQDHDGRQGGPLRVGLDRVPAVGRLDHGQLGLLGEPRGGGGAARPHRPAPAAARGRGDRPGRHLVHDDLPPPAARPRARARGRRPGDARPDSRGGREGAVAEDARHHAGAPPRQPLPDDRAHGDRAPARARRHRGLLRGARRKGRCAPGRLVRGPGDLQLLLVAPHHHHGRRHDHRPPARPAADPGQPARPRLGPGAQRREGPAPPARGHRPEVPVRDDRIQRPPHRAERRLRPAPAPPTRGVHRRAAGEPPSLARGPRPLRRSLRLPAGEARHPPQRLRVLDPDPPARAVRPGRADAVPRGARGGDPAHRGIEHGAPARPEALAAPPRVATPARRGLGPRAGALRRQPRGRHRRAARALRARREGVRGPPRRHAPAGGGRAARPQAGSRSPAALGPEHWPGRRYAGGFSQDEQGPRWAPALLRSSGRAGRSSGCRPSAGGAAR